MKWRREGGKSETQFARVGQPFLRGVESNGPTATKRGDLGLGCGAG